MVEKVQGVAPSRRIRHDAERTFEGRDGFAEGGGQKFACQLRQAMKKHKGEPASSPSAAYVLDVTRPTQSLFYDRQASLEGLSAYLNEEHE